MLVALFLAVQAVTGASNAFRHEVGQLLDPNGMTRQSTDGDTALSAVVWSLQDKHTELAIERIVFPKNSNGVFFAHLVSSNGETRYSSVDPGNAEVLRSGNLWTFPAEAAARIHYNLTIGLPGIFFIATIGLLALIMLTTGILHWWPNRGQRMPGLAIRKQAPRRAQLRQLHRSSGIVMSVFLSFSLITGTVLAINYSLNGLASTPSTGGGLPAGARGDIDAALRLAEAEFPNQVIRDVRFRDDRRADVFVLAPQHSARAVHRVAIDLSASTITKTTPAEANDAVWVTWLPLHTGESLGQIGTALILANAVVLLLLTISGPAIWLVGKMRRHSKLT